MNFNTEVMQLFRKCNACFNCQFQKSILCSKMSRHYLRAIHCLDNILQYPASFYWQIPCHYHFTPRAHILLQNTVSSSVCKNNLCCGIYILKFLPFQICEIWAPVVLTSLILWQIICACVCVCAGEWVAGRQWNSLEWKDPHDTWADGSEALNSQAFWDTFPLHSDS